MKHMKRHIHTAYAQRQPDGQALGKRDLLRYIGLYTLSFIIAAPVVYSPFLVTGSNLVTVGDGWTQHLPVLAYVGRSIRRVILGILHGEAAIPLFDINMGLGADTLGYWFWDPLMALAAFVPTRYIEYLYDFLIIFHVYIAGLSFSAFCCYFRKDRIHTLIGSMVYCFCGYSLVAMVHPPFLNPMITLPLLIMGADKVLRREKPYVFIFSVFYSALCGYYNLYMMTIMIAVYSVVRIFDLYDHRLKETASALCRGVFSYLLGLGLAAVIFLPSVLVFLEASRYGFHNIINTDYTWSYFWDRLAHLISPGATSGLQTVSFPAIALPALVLLWTVKGKRTLRVLTVVSFAAYCSTFCNLVMNGFQYPSTRWVFGIALLVAYIVVDMMPDLLSLFDKQRAVLLGILAVYLMLSVSTSYGRGIKFVFVGIAFLAMTLLVLEEPVPKFKFLASRDICRNMRAIICLLLVIVNVGVCGIFFFAPDQGNSISSYTKSGYMNERLNGAVERELEPYLLENPAGRGDGPSFTWNYGMVWRIPSVLSYNSVTNGNVIRFWKEVENNGGGSDFRIVSSDQRTLVGTLLSQKYYVDTVDHPIAVYGYTPIKNRENRYTVYENNYALPWGYTYDSVMSYEDLDELNGVQKQEAMMQAVALEAEDWNGELAKIDTVEKRIPYEISFKDCAWQNGEFTVSKANATVTLAFSMPADVEGYVRFDKLDLNGSGLVSFNLSVQCGDISKRSQAVSNLYNWYSGRENYLFSLGYSEEERTSLTITFPSVGTFALGDIELYALPMDRYQEQANALRQEPLENIMWGTDSLSGTVDLSKDKILCVSVPYSKGWTATVDGEKAEILKGNYMFMCLPLTAGHHDIEFHYCSPGLKIGAVLTVCSSIAVIGMLVRDKKQKKKELV